MVHIHTFNFYAIRYISIMTPAFIDRPVHTQFMYNEDGEVVMYNADGTRAMHPDAVAYNALVDEFNYFKSIIGQCPDPCYKRASERSDRWYLTELRECMSWYIRNVPGLGLLREGAVDPFPWIPKQYFKPKVPSRPGSALDNGWERVDQSY